MFKWLLYFDFLKKPYEFKLNYNQKNGTVIGGLLSIISGSILLLYFVVSYMTVIIIILIIYRLTLKISK